MRNAESTNDFLPKEMLDPSLNDGRDNFDFHLFFEVVYGYDQEFFLGCGDSEWSQDIYFLYSKGP